MGAVGLWEKISRVTAEKKKIPTHLGLDKNGVPERRSERWRRHLGTDSTFRRLDKRLWP
jgi:hypothetical protein